MSDLPGYAVLPESAQLAVRHGNVEVVAITGPFLVRGRNHVDHIEDGWLVKGEDGYLFGVEDAVFDSQFAIAPANLQNGIYTEAAMYEEVALTDYDLTIPTPPGGRTKASSAKTFGTLPTGVTFSSGGASVDTLEGTPADGTGGVDSKGYYIEVTVTWEDDSTNTYRYAFSVTEVV